MSVSEALGKCVLLTRAYRSSSKTKSHIIEIPGRPQFAEGLPMFPMRSKKA